MLRQVVVEEDEVARADVLDVLKRPGVEVVDADHPIARSEQMIAEMGAEKPAPPVTSARGHVHNLEASRETG